MKIQFEDKSYIEITKSNNSNKFYISIAAKDQSKLNSIVINSVELTADQLKNLIDEIK